jgi:hypothetical protein
MAQVSIDVLEPRKSLIDLDSYSKGNFGIGDDFQLSFLFDDIVLVEFIDDFPYLKSQVMRVLESAAKLLIAQERSA